MFVILWDTLQRAGIHNFTTLGTRVTITGTGFIPGYQTVTIGQTECIIKTQTTTEIVCETDPHPTSTKHRRRFLGRSRVLYKMRRLKFFF